MTTCVAAFWLYWMLKLYRRVEEKDMIMPCCDLGEKLNANTLITIYLLTTSPRNTTYALRRQNDYATWNIGALNISSRTPTQIMPTVAAALKLLHYNCGLSTKGLVKLKTLYDYELFFYWFDQYRLESILSEDSTNFLSCTVLYRLAYWFLLIKTFWGRIIIYIIHYYLSSLIFLSLPV